MEKRTNAMIAGMVAMAVLGFLCVMQAGCSEQCDCSDAVASAVMVENLTIDDLKAQIAKFKSDKETAAEDVKAGEECVRDRLAAVNADVEAANAEEDSKFVEGMRAALGIPSLEEEKSTMTFILAEELLAKKVKCLFIAGWNVPAFYDFNGQVWNGVSYDGGYFPILDILPNGLIKTVEQRKAPEGKFTIIYFRGDDMSNDWSKTEWGRQEGNYDVESDVPELCPIPKGAKKRPIPSGGVGGVKS